MATPLSLRFKEDTLQRLYFQAIQQSPALAVLARQVAAGLIG